MTRSTTIAAVLAVALLASGATWSLSRLSATAAPAAGESTIVAITPTRILDTRPGFGVGLTGRFVSPSPRELRATGQVETTEGPRTVVPTGATGVLLNVTVVDPTADGFVSVRPDGTGGPPATSSLNFTAGDVAPNAVQVSVPTSGPDEGRIEITYDAYGIVGAETDVLIDVVAYTTTSGLDSILAAIDTKADPPIVSRIVYDGLWIEDLVPETPTKLHDVGTFTKAADDTAVRLTWQSQVLGARGDFCVFQIRVDGINDAGGFGLSSSDVVVGASAVDVTNAASAPVSNVTVWDDVAAGEHTVSLWVAGFDTPNCVDNNGRFDRSVLVEELMIDTP